ncbi:MAG TPA: hypothetical protein VFA07_11830 [Chthonomonadaceae bacterium]|nr:hypothetical protein [Chthonomonadaceae bacterium]
MKREEVVAKIYAARTLPEIEAAQKIRAEFLSLHPGDTEILDLGEMLSMTKEALKIINANSEPVVKS